MMVTIMPTNLATTLQVVQNAHEVSDRKEMQQNNSKLKAEKIEAPQLVKVLKLNYHIYSRNLPMTKFTQVFEPNVNSKLPKEMKQMPTDIEAKKTLHINNTLPGEILYMIFRQLIPAVTFPHPDYNLEE